MNLSLNKDQLLMLGNYALAGLGALLASWGTGADESKAIEGVIAIAMSFGLAAWMNLGGTWLDVGLSFARRLVFVLGAYGVAKGWVSETLANQIVQGLLALLPMALSFWHYSYAPGPDLPGTTIVDPPLLLPAKAVIEDVAIVRVKRDAPQ